MIKIVKYKIIERSVMLKTGNFILKYQKFIVLYSITNTFNTIFNIIDHLFNIFVCNMFNTKYDNIQIILIIWKQNSLTEVHNFI